MDRHFWSEFIGTIVIAGLVAWFVTHDRLATAEWIGYSLFGFFVVELSIAVSNIRELDRRVTDLNEIRKGTPWAP